MSLIETESTVVRTPESPPDIILYDYASKLGTCFSRNVLTIRILLNYKRVPYRTVFIEYSDLQEELVEQYVADSYRSIDHESQTADLTVG